MIKFLTGLPGYINLLKYELIIAGCSIFLGIVAYKAYHAGSQAQINRGITASITVREKQNEILNNRPDTGALVKRLRNGKF